MTQTERRNAALATAIRHSTAPAETIFTAEELRALEALRNRVQADRAQLSADEQARLRFLHWRVRHRV